MFETVALSIQKYAKETPDRIALIVGEEKCTYEYLAECNRKIAAYLKEKGIGEGDRIVVEADHILPYMYLEYGIQLLGATFVPIELGTPSNRVREIAKELDTDLMVCLEKREDLEEAWVLGDIVEASLKLADCPCPEAPKPDSLSEILFTTGTTGKSKGVMVTYSNQWNIALAGIETTNIQQDNVWLIPTPMNHAAGLRKVHIAMAVGSTSCLMKGFTNFKLFFNTIKEHNVTSLYLPPSAIHLMLALASKNFAELNGQIRFIYSSSTAYPEADKEKMRKLMPDTYMYNCFGCSEVGVVCTDEFCVSGGSQYPGSVGKPNSLSQIVLLDENGNEMTESSAQNPGLIAIRSKSVSKGYWNEPELTAEAIKGDMLVMSDLCYFAPNGEIILVGRSNDTINLGGLKVAPLEVEEVVRRVPCVDECILIPTGKGASTGLKLLVVVKEGEELDADAIRQVISENLEPYKMPKRIAEVDEIIKTFNGKVDRKKMIAEYA